MRRSLVLVLNAVLLTSAAGGLKALPAGNKVTHEVHKRHKEQRKQLKHQQHAMRTVMGQHEQTSDGRQRFKHGQKMERGMLRTNQRNETRSLKESRRSMKQHPHASS